MMHNRYRCDCEKIKEMKQQPSFSGLPKAEHQEDVNNIENSCKQ